MQKKLKFMFMFMVISLVLSSPAYAAQPGIVTGTRSLLQDALTWVLILIPIAAGLMIAFCSLMKMFSDGDAGSVAKWNSWIKRTIIAGIIGVSAAGIVSAILAYY